MVSPAPVVVNGGSSRDRGSLGKAGRVRPLGEMLGNAKTAVSTAQSMIHDVSGLKRDPVADALA